MNFLYGLHENPSSFNPNSPLEMWLRRNGHPTLVKFDEMRNNKGKPVEFMSDLPKYKFQAIIDQNGTLSERDQLSQVQYQSLLFLFSLQFQVNKLHFQINSLQQLDNIASHQIIQDHIEKGLLDLNVMWFDIYTGEVYFFSKKTGRFIMLDETSIDSLLKEL